MQISAAALWLNTVFAAFDQKAASAVHVLFNVAGGFFTPFFEFISFLGKGGIVLILVSFVLLYFKKTRHFGAAMLLGIAIGALLTNCWLKIAIARPRPYIDNGFFQAMWQSVGNHTESDKSFPSGHTCAAFATMTPVFLVGDKRKSWTAFIFAVLMGIARIYLVVHYATDVIGGLIVGVIAGIIGTFISTKIPSVFYAVEFADYLPSNKGKHIKSSRQ